MTVLRKLSLTYLWCVFVFLILTSLSSFAAMLIYHDISVVFTQLLLIIPFGVIFEIKRRSRYLMRYLGASFAVSALVITAAIVFIDYLPYRILIIIYMVIVVATSIITRLSSTASDLSASFLVTAVAVNAAVSIIARALNIYELELLLVIISLLQFIIYIVYVRIGRLDYALEIIESTSIQPLDKIISFNNLITTLFALVISAVVLLLVFFHAENAFYYAGRSILKLIRFLASLTNSDEPVLLEDPPMPELPSSGDGFDFSMLGEPGKPFFLFVILEKVFFFAMYILIVFGIIFGIGFLCYSMYKRFNERLPENGDIKEFLLPEIVTERTGSILNNIRGFFNAFTTGGDNNQKVRRIFFKKVSSHISKGISISGDDTPSDIKEKIKEKEDVALLAAIYSKARYSNELLSDKEVNDCKR